MKSYYEKGREIIKKLMDSGYQAFFVGGFVRDRLLGINTEDIDITTDATPQEVIELFPKVKETGAKYGTVTVFMGAHNFEITTFRTEGEYLNHRKPKAVSFAKGIEEDLERRDFTINAFAMDYEEEIIDMFYGKQDLQDRLIRAIGDPNLRFNEDALRILRAFRFVSKLGFDIESTTYDCIIKDMSLLKKIANERILTEIKKILQNPYSKKAMDLLFEAGFGIAFPELGKGLGFLKASNWNHLNSLEFFALCFYLENQEVPENWRFSNKERSIIEKIMELVSVTEEDSYNELLIYRLGLDIPLMANEVSRLLDPKNDQVDLIKKIHNELPIRKTCDLAFKGQDILELTTLKNANTIGDIIDQLTYMVISKQLPNDYQALKKYTLELMENLYEEK